MWKKSRIIFASHASNPIWTRPVHVHELENSWATATSKILHSVEKLGFYQTANIKIYISLRYLFEMAWLFDITFSVLLPLLFVVTVVFLAGSPTKNALAPARKTWKENGQKNKTNSTFFGKENPVEILNIQSNFTFSFNFLDVFDAWLSDQADIWLSKHLFCHFSLVICFNEAKMRIRNAE